MYQWSSSTNEDLLHIIFHQAGIVREFFYSSVPSVGSEREQGDRCDKKSWPGKWEIPTTTRPPNYRVGYNRLRLEGNIILGHRTSFTCDFPCETVRKVIKSPAEYVCSPKFAIPHREWLILVDQNHFESMIKKNTFFLDAFWRTWFRNEGFLSHGKDTAFWNSHWTSSTLFQATKTQW